MNTTATTTNYTPYIYLAVAVLGILLWKGKLKLPSSGSSRPVLAAQTVAAAESPDPTAEQLFLLAHLAAQKEAGSKVAAVLAKAAVAQAHETLMAPYAGAVTPGEAAPPSA